MRRRPREAREKIEQIKKEKKDFFKTLMSFITSAERKQKGPTDQLIQTLFDSIPLYNTSICYHFYQYWLQNFTIDCLYLGRNLLARQRDLAECCT